MNTIDNICAEKDLRPKLIKIDVEGFECKVLQGSIKTLNSPGTTWIVEIHPYQLKIMNSSPDKVTRILEDAGLTLTVIDRNPNSLFTVVANEK